MKNINIEITLNIQNLLAILFALIGGGLVIASFIVDPTGEIHSTVEFVLGEIFAFVSALMGVDSYYRGKIQHKKEKGE